MHFTEFDIEAKYLKIEPSVYDYNSFTCPYDHLTITDGDGTIMMEKNCSNSLPSTIKSKSNSVEFTFITDGSATMPGWSVNWTALPSGQHLFKDHLFDSIFVRMQRCISWQPLLKPASH